MIEGLFIALEGVDGAGTTTHTRLLADRLGARGLPVHTTGEPSDGPIGVTIRQILGGRLVVPGLQGARPPCWTTMALLFAADRTDHVEAEIVPNLMDGVTVITDRYVHSSVAYQSLSADSEGGAIEWVRTINQHARRPDLTIVLDIDAETAKSRRTERGGRAELYEYDELQSALAKFYGEIEQHFPDDKIHHVDACQSIEEVAEDVYNAALWIRGERDTP